MGKQLTRMLDLTPFFRDDSGSFWTPNTARDVRTFGYTYPELDGSGVSSSEELRASVRSAVNRLYGRNNNQAGASKRRRRDLGRRRAGAAALLSRRNETEPEPEPATGDTPDTLSSQGKYREYIANIRTQKNALSTSFFVHVFVGNYSSHPCGWTYDPSLVGSHCVFTGGMDMDANATECEQCGDGGTTADVTGAIPLTSTLLEHIKDGRLDSLDPECVDPYLKENLHWRVTLVSRLSSPPPAPADDGPFPR